MSFIPGASAATLANHDPTLLEPSCLRALATRCRNAQTQPCVSRTQPAISWQCIPNAGPLDRRAADSGEGSGRGVEETFGASVRVQLAQRGGLRGSALASMRAFHQQSAVPQGSRKTI